MDGTTASLSHRTDAQRELLVQRWYSAVASKQCVPYDSAEVRWHLCELAHHAITFLIDETSSIDQAQAIGARLVGLHCVQPEALEGTLNVLGQHLLAGLPDEIGYGPVRRVVPLLAGIAAGFTRELRAMILNAQETLHRAEHARLAEERLGRQDHHPPAAEQEYLVQQVAERTTQFYEPNPALIQANRFKGEFLANMSHELRTPLHTILGLAEALLDEVYGSLDTRQREPLLTITQSGHHLLGLVDEMLDLARVEAAQLDLNLAPVDIDALCRASLSRVNQTARARQLRVSLSFDFTIALALVDERCLTQILVNLLNHAIQRTPAGGAVGLEVVGDTVDQVLRFTVWDTGAGCSSEAPEQGQLAQNGGTHQDTAGGLGIAFTTRLVTLHGGTLTVEDTPGEGSRYTAVIPWHAAHTRAVGSPNGDAVSSVTPAANGALAPVTRLVLAEDHEANATLMAAYFEKRGYTVTVAKNGIEVVERTREMQPSVVVMDVRMPQMNGLEAIRRIRSNPATRHIPIVALTGLAMPGDRERCLAAGANAYLTKPVNLVRMVDVIEELRRQAAHGTFEMAERCA